MKKVVLLLAFFAIGLTTLLAQTKEITGTVTSADDGGSMPGVSISVKGTSLGTITDMDGRFQLRVPTDAGTLVFSFVGMTTQEEPIGNRSVINVKLKSEDISVEEVVVVGYGTGKKVGTVVGSFTQVSAEKLKEKPVANIFDALQGKVAGLQVYTSSGEPSQLSSVRLHGSGSLSGSSTPLYVLDGAPLDAGATLSLNTNDFESITILKDASATSIYGTRAANGVIYLTSKKGSADGKSKITFTGQYGFSELANTEFFEGFMNTKQLTDFWVAVKYRTQQQVDDLLKTYPNDTRWNEYYYKEKAPTYQGNLSVSGGKDNTTYYISGSYLFQDGLAYRSEFERYTLRSNITSKVNNWMSIGLNLSGGYDNRASNPYGTNNTNRGLAMLAQPFYSPYDKDGNEYPDLIPGWNRYNPKYLADKNPYTDERVQLNGIGYVQITPIKGLTIKSQGAIDGFDNTVGSVRLPSNKTSLNNGSASETFYRNVNRTLTNTLEYKFNFTEKHMFTALLGQEWIDNTYKTFYATSSKQTDDRLILLSNGTENKDVSSGKSEYAFLSYFGRVDYGLSGKYFFDFSVRQDASSRFGRNNQKTTFYATGAMWNAKKEAFFQNLGFLSTLNLKASIGTSGNAEIGNYSHLALVGTNQYNASTGWSISTPGNPELSWENQTKATLGLKFSVFEDRYRFNIEYYNRTTSDMLVSVPYPYTSGFSSILSNVGSMRNRGVDFAFDFDILKGSDYTLTPYINLNYNRDEVTELFQDRDYWIIPNTGVCWVVGQPISFFYPYFAGIDPADGNPMWYVPGTKITETSTEETTKTFNTANLQQNVGIKRYPPLTGGFGLNADWKGLTLQADFAFALGKYLINNDRYFFENPSSFAGFNQSTTILNYWKKEGDVTQFPKYGVQFTQFDSRLIEDASFMRLKSLTLGYNLPGNLIGKTNFFTNAKIYVNGRNLLTVTDYSGPDPEVDSNLSLGVNPNTKQFTAGIELTF